MVEHGAGSGLLRRVPDWWRRLGAGERDAGIAFVLAGACLLILVTEPVAEPTGVTRRADLGGVALVLAATLPLAARRRAPVVTALTSFAAALAGTLLGYAAALTLLVAAAAIASAVVHSRRPVGLPLAAAGAGVALVVVVTEGATPLSLLAGTLMGAVPATAGQALRSQRALNAELAERAARADALRASELRAAVAEERTRIAQDVHDIVGHHLSAIVLQAGAGRRSAEGGQAATFQTIEELGSAALGETRRTLGLLHAGSAELAPLPALGDLDALVADFRAAGVRVEASLEPAAHVSASVQACAYRIVQEALTNVAKHARPRRAELTLQCTDRELRIRVVSPGGVQRPGTGHGIPGMRGRAQSLGGRLEAGPDHGRWQVRAVLPLDAAP